MAQNEKRKRSLTQGRNVSSFSSAHVQHYPSWRPDNFRQATRNIMAGNKEHNGKKTARITKTALSGKVFGRFQFYFDMSQRKGKRLILS